MAMTVVWLNHEMAKLFHISEERMQRENLRLNPLNDTPHPYGALATRLEGKKKILILSPVAESLHCKDLLHDFLKKHHPQIARSVIAVENLDQPSDHQIATKALAYFSKSV